jgi:hypothetical protein
VREELRARSERAGIVDLNMAREVIEDVVTRDGNVWVCLSTRAVRVLVRRLNLAERWPGMDKRRVASGGEIAEFHAHRPRPLAVLVGRGFCLNSPPTTVRRRSASTRRGSRHVLRRDPSVCGRDSREAQKSA